MRLEEYSGNQMDIIKDQRTKVKNEQRLFHAVNATVRILLAAMEEETFEASILEGMSIVAHCLDFDRGYVWQNEVRNGVLHYGMRFEWQNDTGRQTNPVGNKAVYPYTDIPTWEKIFLAGECVNGPLTDMSEDEQKRLLTHGMKSVFAIPVYIQESFWGYVSFDDCIQERVLGDDELNILRSVSLLIVHAILRKDLTLNIHSASNKLLISKSMEMRSHIDMIKEAAQIGITEKFADNKDKTFEKIENTSNLLLGIINEIQDMIEKET